MGVSINQKEIRRDVLNEGNNFTSALELDSSIGFLEYNSDLAFNDIRSGEGQELKPERHSHNHSTFQEDCFKFNQDISSLVKLIFEAFNELSVSKKFLGPIKGKDGNSWFKTKAKAS